MKTGYAVTVFWPCNDVPDNLCVCANEADAQEMILSVEQSIPYEEYLVYLEYMPNTKPEQFFYNKDECFVNATYEEIPIFE